MSWLHSKSVCCCLSIGLLALSSSPLFAGTLFATTAAYSVPITDQYLFRFSTAPGNYLETLVGGVGTFTVIPHDATAATSRLTADLQAGGATTQLTLTLNGHDVTLPLFHTIADPIDDYLVRVSDYFVGATATTYRVDVTGRGRPLSVPEPSGVILLVSMLAISFFRRDVWR